MPLWLSASLGALIRYCLFGIGTFMVSKGYWDQTVADTFVDGALAQVLSWLLMVGPIVWMFIVKHLDRVTLFNALLTPQVITEETAKAMPTPAPAQIAKVEGTGSSSLPTKVGAVLLTVGLAGSTLACASRGPIHLQVASYGAEMTKIAVQAQTAVLEADKSGLQPNKELTRKAMEAFRQLGGGIQKLATALEAYDVMVPAEQQANLPKIEVLLAEARRLVRAALLFGGSQTEALGGELLKLFDNLDNVFNMIQTTLRPVGATS